MRQQLYLKLVRYHFSSEDETVTLPFCSLVHMLGEGLGVRYTESIFNGWADFGDGLHIPKPQSKFIKT